MYNNPSFYPYHNFYTKPSLFTKFKSLSFSEILNGTQKTLNIINQAIPVFYQLKPLVNNTKTILKIANAINNNQTNTKTNNNQSKQSNQNKTNDSTPKENINYNKPTFFI